jgi:hypothetical protein
MSFYVFNFDEAPFDPVYNRTYDIKDVWLYKSPKTCFGFEYVEKLPGTPENLDWKTVHMSARVSRVVFTKVSLENSYKYFKNSGSKTLIISFFQTIYCNEMLELHLTGVKEYDKNNNKILSDLHLTLRCTSSKEKNRSYHYLLQNSNKVHFRLVLNTQKPNNQNDDMNEYIGQQGYCKYSSAVLQPILSSLSSLALNKGIVIYNQCIKLSNC